MGARAPSRRSLAAGSGSRLAARARLPRGRDHRLDRARPRSRTSPGRSCRSASTPAPRTTTPRSGCRWRSSPRPSGTEAARAGDGDARHRADRRAVRDRGARRRRRSPTSARSTSSCSAPVEAIAEAKAEILAGLGAEGRAVIPADEEALEPHLHDRLETVTFGPGGDVFASRMERRDGGIEATIVTPAGEAPFRFPFAEAHNLANADVRDRRSASRSRRRSPRWRVGRRGISFSRLRGERVELPGGSVLINDCYNANPVSMRAALEHLAAADVGGRTDRGPRRDGRARPRRARLPPRDRRARARGSASTWSSGSATWRATTAPTSGRPTPRPPPRPPSG